MEPQRMPEYQELDQAEGMVLTDPSHLAMDMVDDPNEESPLNQAMITPELPKCPFKLESPCSLTLTDAMRRHLLDDVHKYLGPDYHVFVLEPAIPKLGIKEKGNIGTVLLQGIKKAALDQFKKIEKAAGRYPLFSHSIKYPEFETLMRTRTEVYLVVTKLVKVTDTQVQSLLEADPPIPPGWVVLEDNTPKKNTTSEFPDADISRTVSKSSDISATKADQIPTIDLPLPRMSLHLSHPSPLSPVSTAPIQSISYHIEWFVPYQNSTGRDTLILLVLFIIMAGVPWLLQVLASKYPPK